MCTRGYIDLHTVFCDGHQTKTIPVRFLVVEAHTSYNVLLGRPLLNTLCAIVSTPHLAMQFPSSSGDIITIHGDQRLARECYIASLRPKELVLTTNNIEREPRVGLTLIGEDLDPRIGCDSHIEPVEDTKSLELSLRRNLKLGVGLSHNDQDLIEATLKSNKDLFAWSATNLLSVDPQITVYKLSIYREPRYVS